MGYSFVFLCEASEQISLDTKAHHHGMWLSEENSGGLFKRRSD